MSNNVAVIMSIYKHDDITEFNESITSLIEQTYKNFDIYIAIDGEVDNSILSLLEEFKQEHRLYTFQYVENEGLARRLNDLIEIILEENKYEFVARMDADDISLPERIAKQVEFLNENESVSIIGTDVIEFGYGKSFYKKMETDHKKILSNIIKKCPLNHPTVMFRASIFKSGFRYNSKLRNTQDYYFWIDLLAKGYIISNINEPLLKFRINDSFFRRRGFSKALNDVKVRNYAMKKLGVYSLKNISYTFLLFVLRVSPEFIKKIAYRYMR